MPPLPRDQRGKGRGAGTEEDVQRQHAAVSATENDSSPYTYKCMTYNIMSKYLGSNGIPWLMSLYDDDLQKRIEAVVGEPFDKWKNKVLTPYYLQHFHSSKQAGWEYKAMRELWSRRISSQSDIPTSLEHVLFCRENVISYPAPPPSLAPCFLPQKEVKAATATTTATAKHNACQREGVGETGSSTQKDKEGARVEATTLHGLLFDYLPQELAAEALEKLLDLEARCFSWDTRGPRLVARILREAPDIFTLQEYDFRAFEFDYDGAGMKQTLHGYLHGQGYTCILTGGCMVGWKRSRLAPVASNLEGNLVEDLDALLPFHMRPLTLSKVAKPGVHAHAVNHPSAPEAFRAAFWSFSMEEKWHEKKCDGSYSTQPSSCQEVRSVALTKLRPVEDHHGPIYLVHAHLMTTGRDCFKRNAFKGEVRASELEFIRTVVGGIIEEDVKQQPHSAQQGSKAGTTDPSPPHVIFMGDFNTSPDELAVWTGVPEVAPALLQQSPSISPPTFRTGWNSQSKTISWGDTIELSDVFLPLHQCGRNVGKGEDQVWSSRTTQRLTWIDYMWASQSLKHRPVPLCLPHGPIPNTTEPSDHVPLCAYLTIQEQG